MAAFLDNCRFNVTAGGTTDWTYATTATGYQSPALAGAVNGTKYKFIAISSDQSQWEITEGAYNSGTGVFARTTVLYNSSGTGTAAGQSGAGTKINFTVAPQVAIIGVKEDLLAFDELNSFNSAQQEQARINLLAERIIAFNGTIVESHASNAVTFAVKTLTGNDASAATPVIFAFPNGSGGVAFVSVTSALSITIPSGATLGQSDNASAFRVWIAAFNDSGTVRLAVRCCSSSASAFYSVNNPDEKKTNSSTLTPANSAHTFYTTGAGVTSKFWVWIAAASYESGLATAGLWSVSPDVIALADAATVRPGAVIQRTLSTGPSGTLSVTDTGGPYDITTFNITPHSAANFIEFLATCYIFLRVGTSSQQGTVMPTRSNTPISGAPWTFFLVFAGDAISTIHPHVLDKPNSVAAQTYKLRAQNIGTGTGLVQYSAWQIILNEIVT